MRFDPVGVVEFGRNADRTKGLWQAALLYTVRIAKEPPFADRAPRPVGQCDASPRDRQLLGCRCAGSQRRAIRTLGTRSRYKAPLTRPWPISPHRIME